MSNANTVDRQRRSELQAELFARNAFLVTMWGSVMFVLATAYTMLG